MVFLTQIGVLKLDWVMEETLGPKDFYYLSTKPIYPSSRHLNGSQRIWLVRTENWDVANHVTETFKL